MSDHSFEWTIDVLGMEIDVTVEYVLESHGEPDNYWTGGGSAPEFYINEVIDQWGNDITDWCTNNHDYTKPDRYRKIWNLGYTGYHNVPSDCRKDPIEALMFGALHRHFINPYLTYEDILHEAIMDHDVNDAIDSECEEAYCRRYGDD